jgi:hypothetical protein
VTLHRKYQANLKAHSYDYPQPKPVEEANGPKLVYLKEAAKMYLNFLQDIDVPAQEKKGLHTLLTTLIQCTHAGREVFLQLCDQGS